MLQKARLAPVLNARNLLTFCSPSGIALGSVLGEPDRFAGLLLADASSAPASDQRSCIAGAVYSIRCAHGPTTA